MKTKDAFALRNFDVDNFIRAKLDECGLNKISCADILKARQLAGSIDTSDIFSLQEARRKYFKLQTILDDFIRRICRHQQRLRNFQSAVLLDSDTREIPTQRIDAFKKIFTSYTVLTNNVLPYCYTLLEIISAIDFYQRRYFKEIFKKRLRQARKAKGLLQSDLSAVLGINPTSYGNYERGRSSPDVPQIGTLAQFLDVTPNWLFGFE